VMFRVAASLPSPSHMHNDVSRVTGHVWASLYSLNMQHMQHNSLKTSLHEYGPGSTLPWGVLGCT
jgi:hypothetical protein